MAKQDELRATVTQAFAVTVVDESQRPTSPDSSAPPTKRDATRQPIDSEPDSDPLPGDGNLVGLHYELVRTLGEGMFGRVFVARRIDVPEHKVALKLIRRALYAGRNVERELVILATVGHPNVVQLKDHGMTSDYVWLTMPMYEGETLQERLDRGPLTLREAYDIFLPIARGVEALHRAGLRHQDIKPENIFLAEFAGRMHPILLDLGVAAERDSTFIAGTALYGSPEQLVAFAGIIGALPLTEKMDTYCLASTLLRSLVGPDYYPGEKAKTRDEMAEAHEARETRPLADEALLDLDPSSRSKLEAALKRWFAHHPDDRPSVADMADDLDVLLEPERQADLLEQRARRQQKTNLQRATFAAAAFLLIAVAGGGVAYSKRETLRLASELQEAQAIGAESFDKLDECVASHQLAQQRARSCGSARRREQSEFQASLASIQASGSESEAERARQIEEMRSTYSSRLATCEEEAAEAAEAHAAEVDLLNASHEKQRERWEADIARMEQELASQSDQLETCNDGLDGCALLRDSCFEARDACLASQKAAASDALYGDPGPPKGGPPPPTAPPPSDDPYEG